MICVRVCVCVRVLSDFKCEQSERATAIEQSIAANKGTRKSGLTLRNLNN